METTFERPLGKTLATRLDESPRWIVMITGPRQAGKTTLVRQVLKRIGRPFRHIAVDAPEPTTASAAAALLPEAFDSARPTATEALPPVDKRDARWLVREWERARLEARRSDLGFVLALDEIQKVPNWSETVKGLWDQDRLDGLPLHVVLLGSAPLRMQRGMSESLAGRYETIAMRHWSFEEMAAAFDFDLDRYIYFGGYPGPAPVIHDEPRWRDFVYNSLIEPSVERDILALQRVDKPALLKRLFGLGAEYSGQILAYNKMLGQLQDAGNTTTLARYLDLLSMAGLITGLPKYVGRAHLRRASSPKLNVLNTALTSVHSRYSFGQARADRTFWGRLVESAVGAHLVNTGGRECRVHYWRDRRGREVDFVLERGRELIAFEVKSGRRGNVGGLDAFGRDYPVKAAHEVGRGGIPLPEFLLTPASEWFDGS